MRLSDSARVTLPAKEFDALLESVRKGIGFGPFQVLQGAATFDPSHVPHPVTLVERTDVSALYRVDQPGWTDLHVAAIRYGSVEIVNLFPSRPSGDAMTASFFVTLLTRWRAAGNRRPAPEFRLDS